MSSNVGTLDRILRLIVGVALLAAPFVSNASLFQSAAATAIAAVVGSVLIATAALKFCPMYRLFGLRTCKV